MRWIVSHITGKAFKNENYILGKKYVLGKTKIHAIPKTWKNEFPYYGKSMEKHKHSKALDALHISVKAVLHTITGWVISHITGKVWENTDHS